MQRAEKAYRIFRDGKARELLTPRTIIILGAALLYLVSPLDGIPDVVPIVGLLDDLGILSMVLAAVLPAFLEQREDLSEEERKQLEHEAEVIEAQMKEADMAPPGAEATEGSQVADEESNSSFISWSRRFAGVFSNKKITLLRTRFSPLRRIRSGGFIFPRFLFPKPAYGTTG